MAKKTLYQILGVPRDSNAVDIGLGHQRRLDQMNRMVPQPDAGHMALLQQAYEILSNPEKRAAYDAQLLTAAERTAAIEMAATPDLELGEDDVPKKKPPVALIAAGVVVVAVIAFFLLRSPGEPPAPEPVAAAPAPEPPPPPPPKSGAQILADVTPAAGRVLSYSMSGAATPVGIALATERGAMVTGCRAIPVGAKLVVNVGPAQHAADLTITDEVLDLCRLSVTGLGQAPLSTGAAPKAGDKVYALGLDGKGALRIHEAGVKAVRATPTGETLELSAPVAANASGAGIFDEFGKLVAIATGGTVAVPVSHLTQMRSRSKPPKQ